MLEAYYTNGLGSMERVEPRLAAALCDVVARPGSMVRAVTAYLVAIEMGLTEETAKALACGIEYLHTSSLVFDDLPAMDDARTRRGAACLHVVHGEAIAMLASLALINRGYALLWQGINRADSKRREFAGQWLDERLGLRGLIGGQAFDLRGWRDDQNAEEVSAVAARKTGELLRLTLALPAIIGDGTARHIQLLDRLALLRGLAYQVADDLKDVFAQQGDYGKTSGRDGELGRPNMVAAEGVVASFIRFQRLQQAGDRVVAALPGPPECWEMLQLLRVAVPDGLILRIQKLLRAAG
jgi:geranylgeranyl pyrophosphate synthase